MQRIDPKIVACGEEIITGANDSAAKSRICHVLELIGRNELLVGQYHRILLLAVSISAKQDKNW